MYMRSGEKAKQQSRWGAMLNTYLNTESFQQELRQLQGTIEWIIIDEIQKVPKLLDLVHKILEEQEREKLQAEHVQKEIHKTNLSTLSRKFILTGSSARKLKRGAANLLAGRAFVFKLFPFSFQELGEAFNLHEALMWGLLPKITSFETDLQKKLYLVAYTSTYLKEELLQEQIIRKLEPFRRFLEVAGQTSGTIINFEKIGRDVGTSTKTVQSYYQILEETLLGILLQPFHTSIRKRQRANPKFYFFDTGVERAVTKSLDVPLQSGTYSFGRLFESFVINEINKLLNYKLIDFELSYLRTKDDAEIDLIVEQSGKPISLVEIKSKNRISKDDIQPLIKLAKDIPSSISYCLSLDPIDKDINGVKVLYWERGIKEICE
jgi:uncharacterized protein